MLSRVLKGLGLGFKPIKKSINNNVLLHLYFFISFSVTGGKSVYSGDYLQRPNTFGVLFSPPRSRMVSIVIDDTRWYCE